MFYQIVHFPTARHMDQHRRSHFVSDNVCTVADARHMVTPRMVLQNLNPHWEQRLRNIWHRINDQDAKPSKV